MLYTDLIQPLYHGDYRKGEIELIADATRIAEIEQLQKNRLLKKGYSEEFSQSASRVGIIAEDTYWLWLRDAVQFPNGTQGTYDRLLWRTSLDGAAGVAVLPITPDGQIALALNFRHATRTWELELPREARRSETPEEAARRCISEETGYTIRSLTPLGDMTPDTGVLNTVVPLFLARLDQAGPARPDDSEAIESVHLFTQNQLIEGFKRGHLELTLRGERRSIPLRDAFLAFALFQAHNLNLLSVLK